MSSHVFISYRRDGDINQRWAERVHERLAAEGFNVWRDVKGIEPGQRWAQVIPPALDQAAMVLCVISASLLESDWVDDELNYARHQKLLVVPLQVESVYQPPFHLTGVEKLDLHADDPGAWTQLIQLVARHAGGIAGSSRQRTSGTSRDRELRYLDRLLYTQKAAQLTPIYTELAGVERRMVTLAKALPPDLMPVTFRHARVGDEDQRPGEGVPHNDILAVFKGYAAEGVVPRVAILGEPGAGKSFSLRRLSAELATHALNHDLAPLPLLVELGKWTDPAESFAVFVQSALGDLGRDWEDLLATGRAYLLIDALNEIPTAQQSFKIDQVRPWIADRRLAGLVLSCRERDFVGDLKLDMDTLVIEPLDPPRIHLFIRRYLDVIDPTHADERADAFFWRLATGDDERVVSRVRTVWRRLHREGLNDFTRFWHGEGDQLAEASDTIARRIAVIEKDRRALLWMARNPYLLNILLGLYLEGRLPPHHERRAAVFARFADDLLARERERYRRASGDGEPPGEQGLLDALGRFAWDLQNAGIDNGRQSVQTTVLMPKAKQSLTPAQMKHAQAASLIEVRGSQVFFTHQLLQEYFAARGLKVEIDDRHLAAHDIIWPIADEHFDLPDLPPVHWSERGGWEEVVNTLGGLYVDNPEPLVQWLADTNPEVLADSLVSNGIHPARSPTLIAKSREWVQRMTEPEREPEPAIRAALGRAVGKLNVDDRHGVGLDERGLPDILWKEIPAGASASADEEWMEKLPTFFIGCYPITNVQFQAFIDDGGYRNDAFWSEARRHKASDRETRDPHWSEPNHPRETVSWFEAMAFCSWLSEKFGYEIRLPTEAEWEKAARGTDGRVFPWGEFYEAGHANVNERRASEGGHSNIDRTTAVGIYPLGNSPYGVADMVGNVWEWCLDYYESADGRAYEVSGWWYDSDERVLRGGCWSGSGAGARPSRRAGYHPYQRDHVIGFRVVCASPGPSGSLGRREQTGSSKPRLANLVHSEN